LPLPSDALISASPDIRLLVIWHIAISRHHAAARSYDHTLMYGAQRERMMCAYAARCCCLHSAQPRRRMPRCAFVRVRDSDAQREECAHASASAKMLSMHVVRHQRQKICECAPFFLSFHFGFFCQLPLLSRRPFFS